MKIKRCHKPGPICVSQPKAICFWGREKKSCQGPSGAGGGDCRGADAEEKSSSDAQKRVVKYLSPHARTHPATATSPPSSPLPLRRRWHLRAPRPRRPPRLRRWPHPPERRLRALLLKRRHKTLPLPRPRRPGARIWRRRCAARSGSARRW